MKTTILVTVSDNKELPGRLFYSLARNPPKGDFEVVLADKSGAEVGKDALRLFISAFKTAEQVDGKTDKLLHIPGYAVPIGNAIQTLIDAHRPSAMATGLCLDAGVFAAEELDKFGSNYTPLMVSDVLPTNAVVSIHTPSEPYSDSFTAHDAQFLLMKPTVVDVGDDFIPVTSDHMLKTKHVGLQLLADPTTKDLWHRSVSGTMKRAARLPIPDSVHQRFAFHLVWATNNNDWPWKVEYNADTEWKALWATEEARRAAFDGNIEAIAKRVDYVWSLDRQMMQTNHFDKLYASLRMSGALGGCFWPGGVTLIVPPDKHAAVRGVFKEHHDWKVI